MQHQLAANEELIDVKIDTSEFGKHAFDGIARIFALQRMVEIAGAQGLTILHGPEITEVHRPRSPGEPAWMRAAAVVQSL